MHGSAIFMIYALNSLSTLDQVFTTNEQNKPYLAEWL